MNHSIYPTDWHELARSIKDANGYVCQGCDKQCRRPGELWLGWEYTLTVAHLCQDYEGEAVCVACLCLPCHLRHDAPLSGVARQRNRRWRQHHAGQLALALKAR